MKELVLIGIEGQARHLGHRRILFIDVRHINPEIAVSLLAGIGGHPDLFRLKCVASGQCWNVPALPVHIKLPSMIGAFQTVAVELSE